MKVKDLIVKLQAMPPEAIVINPYWSDDRTPVDDIFIIPTDDEHDCYDFYRELSPVGVVRFL